MSEHADKFNENRVVNRVVDALCAGYDAEIAKMHEEFSAVQNRMVSFQVVIEKIATSEPDNAVQLARDVLEQNKTATNVEARRIIDEWKRAVG